MIQGEGIKKVLLTATVQSHICQFHKPLAEMLHAKGYEVHVAAKNNLAEKNGLKLDFADKVFDVPFSRSPKSLDNMKAYRQLKAIIDEERYDAIHCNTPMGGLVTRAAAAEARKNGTKIIYTAHGFHFYKGAPKKNWLVYYPIEKMMLKHTDVLITINREDYQLARRKMSFAVVEYIPGTGVEIDRFANVVVDRDLMRQSIGIAPNAFLIIAVGELNENKNQQVMISALSKINDKDIHFAIVGNGPNKDKLVKMADELGVAEQVHFLGYRRDIAELYKSSDVCSFTSVREGLGLACIEALATGIPVVAAKNRGTADLIVDGINGFLLDKNDIDGFANAIRKIKQYGSAALSGDMDERKKIIEKYDVRCSVQALKNIYERVLPDDTQKTEDVKEYAGMR